MARARGLPTSIACERAAGTSFNFMTLLLNLFWVISVYGEHCLHLASLGLPHWAGVGGPLVSGIDCRYTGCPARNTNNQYPPPPPNPHRKPISKLSAIECVPEDLSKYIGRKIQSLHKSQWLSIPAEYRTPISEWCRWKSTAQYPFRVIWRTVSHVRQSRDKKCLKQQKYQIEAGNRE